MDTEAARSRAKSVKQSEYGLVSRMASMGRRIERPRHRHGQAGSDGGGMAHEGLEQQILLQGADAVDPIRVTAAAEPGHRRCRSRLGDPPEGSVGQISDPSEPSSHAMANTLPMATKLFKRNVRAGARDGVYEKIC